MQVVGMKNIVTQQQGRACKVLSAAAQETLEIRAKARELDFLERD